MYVTAYNNETKSMTRIFDRFADFHQARMRDEEKEREKLRMGKVG